MLALWPAVSTLLAVDVAVLLDRGGLESTGCTATPTPSTATGGETLDGALPLPPDLDLDLLVVFGTMLSILNGRQQLAVVYGFYSLMEMDRNNKAVLPGGL